jgi:membrane fusion protein
MSSSLFRPEALEHQRQAWLGDMQLLRPLSLRLLTATVLLVLSAVAAFLWWGEYTRKARVAGVLVPEQGVIRLLPPQEAVVLERHAVEGARVARGEVLFVLSLERSSAAGDTQATVQRSLRERERSLADSAAQQALLSQAQTAAADQRLADMRRERTQRVSEALLHKQRLALARDALARLESLRGENFISAAQVQAKQEELLGLQAQLQALERDAAAHERAIMALEAERRELPLRAQAQQGEIERERAEVAQQAAESEARRRLVVHAPVDGVVSAVLAQPGQTVTPAAALASLVPAGSQLQAHLYAPSSAVGFVQPDQTVLLRYQAYAYQKFGHQRGRVLQVSRTPLSPADQAALAGAQPQSVGEPLYRITVALDKQQVSAYGQDISLVPGMQLDADVLLDRRRLVEWIFEPLLGLGGRV